MKGIVYRFFQDYVEETWSAELVDEMLSLDGLSTEGAFTSVGNYPHDDFVQMLAFVADRTNIDLSQLIYNFGEALFHRLASAHHDVIAGFDSCIDLLAGIESVIHRDVRKIYDNTELPRFDVVNIQGKEEITIQYRSSRPFADLAHGLIAGAISYYGLNASSTIIRETPLYYKDNARFRVVFKGKGVKDEVHAN